MTSDQAERIAKALESIAESLFRMSEPALGIPVPLVKVNARIEERPQAYDGRDF